MTGPRHDFDDGSHDGNLNGARDASAVDVLVDAVLTGDRGAGFDAALASCGGRVMQELESTAAALMVALEPPAPSMPAHLRDRVADALSTIDVASSDDRDDHHATQAPTAPRLAPPAPADAPAREPRSSAGLGVIGAIGFVGWALAAASIALAIFAWWPGLEGAVGPAAEALVTPASLRARPGIVRLDWTGTEDATVTGTVSGEVLWDPDAQQGCMVINGLAANDPTELQYQLWIFDAERDERYPVDGGVFDIATDGEQAVIPIRATLPVQAAALFAVTVEPPGGVVVSDRRIALVAQR